MYATAAASRLWEDHPSPPLAQAAQDAPSPEPTNEDIHQVLHMRAPTKTHARSAPSSSLARTQWTLPRPPRKYTSSNTGTSGGQWSGTTTVWSNGGAAHVPDDEVPPPPRGGDRLRLATRVPDTPEAAWEALHYALYCALMLMLAWAPLGAGCRGSVVVAVGCFRPRPLQASRRSMTP